jgi:YbgC/YbaW family acyl-CoA thioester hydrolase
VAVALLPVLCRTTADGRKIFLDGNYAQYFEVGRVEFLRSRGLSYKDLEAESVMMPVVALKIKYKRPAKYDDLLTIRSQVARSRISAMFLLRKCLANQRSC